MEFHCKQFSLNHSTSSMKVGTDSILLSSLGPAMGLKNILDIGCGCGIVSLCMAQKYINPTVFGIDIDENSVQEAKYNFENSKFSDRLSVKHTDFNDFSEQENECFDLIISNPPFFIDSLNCPDNKRNKARHTVSLSFENLIKGVNKLLSDNGVFCVILPALESKKLEQIANEKGLIAIYQANIYSKEDKPCERIVFHFSKDDNKIFKQEKIILRNSDNSYSEQYIKLTSEFLL